MKIWAMSAWGLMSLCLFSCDKFDTRRMIKEKFGSDLEGDLSVYEHFVGDGIIYVEGVKDGSPLFTRVLPSHEIEKERKFYHKGKLVSQKEWGSSVYKNWGERDGVSQFAIYFPKVEKLLIGYFSGMDE